MPQMRIGIVLKIAKLSKERCKSSFKISAIIRGKFARTNPEFQQNSFSLLLYVTVFAFQC